ncbi:MAG: hypothetical protein AB1Z31_06170 [Desulfobacterales bacterium]
MTSTKKIVSAFLAALFMTGLLASAPVSAVEKGCVSTNSIEELSAEEYFHLYES